MLEFYYNALGSKGRGREKFKFIMETLIHSYLNLKQIIYRMFWKVVKTLALE